MRASLLKITGDVADLTGANLSGANLTNAYFGGSIACGESSCGSFPGANLTGANLSGADARGANFYLATLDRREYQQSDSVRRAHRGPRPDSRRVAGRPRL